MIGDLIGELIVKPVLECFIEGVCYWTGKPLLYAISLGHLHVAFDVEPRRVKGKNPGWSATFVRDGKRYVDTQLTMLIGLVTWGIAIGAIVWVCRG